MNAVIKEIYEHLPDTLPVPAHLRHQRAEVTILPLDAAEEADPQVRRRRALALAWGCVKLNHAAADLARDLAAQRAEWDHRP